MNRFASAPWPLKAAYVAVLAAAGLSLLMLVACAIALAGLHRLSPHLNALAVPGWFWYFRADPIVRRWLGAGAMGALSMAAIGAMAIARSLRPPLHGAARWASEAELARGGLRAREGVVVGRKGGRLLIFGGDEHVMLYAPTRAGKGVGVVIPNLLVWSGSTVVLDVKRENWEATAGFRASHGQEVHCFDPLDPEGRTARFNPLGHIDRTDCVAVLDELQKLAVMLFPASPVSDPFWAEAARTGFIGVGALVAETCEGPFSLGEIFQTLTRGDPRLRLPEVLDERRAAGRALSAGCSAAISDFCSASENTFASIKQTITARMNLWLNPRVCAATEASDFDLRDLRDRRISLYLTVSPDNLARVAPLYSLLLQQLIDLSTRERPTQDRHTIPVLLLLDEFARLGRASVIAHGFAYVAGYGLRLLPVLQSPAQLRAEYGHDLAEEIAANCGLEITFAPKELKVAQNLSERIGVYTYPARSKSRPSGLASGRSSQTESDQRRALMMSQELIQMPPDRLIALRAGLAPVMGRKIVYWKERAFRNRLMAAPVVAPRPLSQAHLSQSPASTKSPVGDPRETHRHPGGAASLDQLDQGPAASGLEPFPIEDATPLKMESWLDRYIEFREGRRHAGSQAGVRIRS